VVYVGFVGDFDITYGSNLWMQSLVDCWQGLRFIYFTFILTLSGHLFQVFFTAARFSSLFTSSIYIVLIGIYCSLSLIVVYSLYLTSDLFVIRASTRIFKQTVMACPTAKSNNTSTRK